MNELILPKGFYVVPFWVCYVFWVRDYNILPQKEQHWRVWVVMHSPFTHDKELILYQTIHHSLKDG